MIAGKDGEMFVTRNFNVTPKTTEQHLIARNDKSVAYMYVKDSVGLFVLLKLTTCTDKHEASRGLFATAELVVGFSYSMRQCYEKTIRPQTVKTLHK